MARSWPGQDLVVKREGFVHDAVPGKPRGLPKRVRAHFLLPLLIREQGTDGVGKRGRTALRHEHRFARSEKVPVADVVGATMGLPVAMASSSVMPNEAMATGEQKMSQVA